MGEERRNEPKPHTPLSRILVAVGVFILGLAMLMLFLKDQQPPKDALAFAVFGVAVIVVGYAVRDDNL